MNAIRVDNVSKRFLLRHARPRHLADGLRAVLRRSVREEFWAVKDVSFEVDRGEALGIIGHNGAGKSTMLKLLTRIMEPTSGRIRTRGRVSALIEVGAGFHPEMTGRENIYLNGSILGMTRREIRRKLDDMVAFSELERFIDTPVKRYSSGMYVRLGFAVAAHTEPEVLLVDEVLAVGDISFQSKCLDAMQRLRREGVTICLVSHNLSLVRNFCARTILLAQGRVSADGPSASVVDCYTRTAQGVGSSERTEAGLEIGLIRSVRLMDSEGRDVTVLASGKPLTVAIRFRTPPELAPVSCGVFLHRSDGLYCHGARSFDHSIQFDGGEETQVDLSYGSVSLAAGTYDVSVGIYSADGSLPLDYHDRRYSFEVSTSQPDGGCFILPHSWLEHGNGRTVG